MEVMEKEDTKRNIILPSFQETLQSRALAVKERNSLLMEEKKKEEKKNEWENKIKSRVEEFLFFAKEKYGFSQNEVCKLSNDELLFLWGASLKHNERYKDMVFPLYLFGVVAFLLTVVCVWSFFSHEKFIGIFTVFMLVMILFSLTGSFFDYLGWRRMVSFIKREGSCGLRKRLGAFYEGEK